MISIEFFYESKVLSSESRESAITHEKYQDPI